MAHSCGFDVTFLDPRSRVLQIQGPALIDIMKAVSDRSIDETMMYFRAGYFDLGAMAFCLAYQVQQ